MLYSQLNQKLENLHNLPHLKKTAPATLLLAICNTIDVFTKDGIPPKEQAEFTDACIRFLIALNRLKNGGN